MYHTPSILGALLFTVLFPKSVNAENPLFFAFHQQSAGNCASIALIKAMMGQFGVSYVYETLPTSLDIEHRFRLKDGSTVELSTQQLNKAIASTGFKEAVEFDHSIRAYADTCYAIMCMMHMRVKENATYEAAIESLSNGYVTKSIGELIGVQLTPIKPSSPGRLSQEQHILIYNTYHAVYASDGLYDEAKKNGPVPIRSFRWRRKGWKTVFGIRGISGALRITSAAKPPEGNQ